MNWCKERSTCSAEASSPARQAPGSAPDSQVQTSRVVVLSNGYCPVCDADCAMRKLLP